MHPHQAQAIAQISEYIRNRIPWFLHAVWQFDAQICVYLQKGNCILERHRKVTTVTGEMYNIYVPFDPP